MCNVPLAQFARTRLRPRAFGLALDPPAGRIQLRTWYTVLLILLGALWGLQFVLIKAASDAHIGELAILAVGLSGQAALYVAILAWRRAGFRPTWRHLRFFAISALFGFILPLGAAAVAVSMLSAGMVVFYESLTPILTVALVTVLRLQRQTPGQLAAIVLSTGGLCCVLLPNLLLPSSGQLNLLLVAFVIPCSYAIDGIYVARCWPADLQPLQVVTGEAIAGAALVLPAYLLFGEPVTLAGGWGDVGAWSLAGLVATGLLEAYLYFYLLRKVGAVFVSFACFISLSAGIFLGALFFGEAHPPGFWFAVALLCASLFLLSRKPAETARQTSSARPQPAHTTRAAQTSAQKFREG